jgi:oxygen-independent coproporphyrinogen-3 oxidase
MRNQPAGLYIHIPFCFSRCPYCGFYSQTDLDLIPSFVSALKQEMSMIAPFPPAFDTLYLGGGTPSLLEPDVIAEIIEASYRRFPLTAKAEITIEANPGTVTPVYLKEIIAVGINRISIGIQSFEDRILRFLGRMHSGAEAIASIRDAREAGFENIGIDLMYGLPGQSAEDWITALKTAVSRCPEHIACYMLTFEPRTLFDEWKNKGKIKAAEDEAVSLLFETTIDFLEKSGYNYYEISNFAKIGHYESRHNRKYWSHAPYIGLGPSAHSFMEPVRSWNHSSLKKYLKDVRKGRRPVAGNETLTDNALILEATYLGLRTAKGISIKDINQRFGMDFGARFAPILKALEKEGVISLTPERCVLTRKGRLFCDGIAARLVG